MNPESDIVKWVTFGIAVGGFLLGVVNYLNDLFRNRPRALVTARNYYSGTGRRIGLRASIVNDGEKAFTVTDAFLVVANGKRCYDLARQGDEVPKVVEPGMQCQVVFGRESYLCSEGPDVVRVAFEIASDREFKSKKLSHDFVNVPDSLSFREPGKRTIAVNGIFHFSDCPAKRMFVDQHSEEKREREKDV